jgi:DNA (cytosine-5)-methyltransferase 1
MNYYNEWDKFAAEWLKQLIKDGLIPDGEVDNRSIADVEPSELTGFTQCHFFAGIGGWSRALQLAGWSPDRPVWTGSPPCQSFSTAGKGKGKDDERHLWPVFFNLIRECQPTAVFGEQVAAAIRHGWLDDLQNDFEAEGYASGAVVLPSGSIGAYHKRDRLFFTAKRVAYADSGNRWGEQEPRKQAGNQWRKSDGNSGIFSSVADSTGCRHKQSEQFSNSRQGPSDKRQSDSSRNCESQHKLVADSIGERSKGFCGGWQKGITEHSQTGYILGNPDSNRSQQGNEASETTGHWDTADSAGIRADSVAYSSSKQKHQEQQRPAENEGKRSAINNSGCSVDDEGLWDLWENPQIIYCRDGKYRPIPTEPALFPLADGIPNRVGILRGAGNAIVPQAAAEIIKTVM